MTPDGILGDAPGDQLRLCRERFSTLLELGTEWYWEQDEELRFTIMIGERPGDTGVDLRSYIGKCRWQEGSVPVADNGSWETHKAVLAARLPFADFVFRRAGIHGEMRYLSTSGQPVFENGRFRGYRGIARDITTAMRAEQLLRLEHRIASCIADAADASSALTAMMRAICETQGWECGRYFAVDERGGTLRFFESWHRPDSGLEPFIEQSRKLTYTDGSGLIGEAWQTARPLWVTDIHADPRIKMGIARDLGMRGTFLFPVIADGRPVGVLSFHSRQVREPEERLLQAVSVIGSHVGQFMQRKQAEERAHHLATHDWLTVLPNRAMFSQLLSRAVANAKRYPRIFSVFFIDLDGFKTVNDTLGHDAGDKLLQETSVRFRKALRDSDVLARLGGDEFVALVEGVGTEEQIASVAAKLLRGASDPHEINGATCQVSASIGISVFPADAQDDEMMMRHADTAMYQAKKQGKNRYQVYQPDPNA